MSTGDALRCLASVAYLGMVIGQRGPLWMQGLISLALLAVAVSLFVDVVRRVRRRLRQRVRS